MCINPLFKQKNVFSVILFLFIIHVIGENKWSILHPVPQINDIQFVNSETGYALGQKGIFFTYTQNKKWKQTQYISEYVGRKLSFINENNGWILTDFSLLQTKSAGRTWVEHDQFNFIDSLGKLLSSIYTNYHTYPEGFNSLCFNNDSIGWATLNFQLHPKNPLQHQTEIGVVAKSVNGGDTWDVKFMENLDTTVESYIYSLQNMNVNFQNSDSGWVTGHKGRMYYTSNSGQDWDTVITDTNYTMKFIKLLDNKTGIALGYKEDYSVDREFSVFTSIDNGLQWIHSNQSLAVDDVLDLQFYNGQQGYLLSQVSENSNQKYTVHRIDNRGTMDTISSVPSGVDLDCLWFRDSLNGYVGSHFGVNHGSIQYTDDGGSTWTQQISSTVANGHYLDFIDVFFVNKNIGWAITYDYGEVCKTEDGGVTWAVIHKIGNNPRLDEVLFVNEKKGWAKALRKIWKTADGISWELCFDSSIQIEGLSFIDSLTGWMAYIDGSNNGIGGISRTDDGGYTWKKQDAICPYGMMDVQFIDHYFGFSIGSTSRIFRTTNGGVDWVINNIDSLGTTAQGLRKIFFLDKNIGWILCINGGVLRTVDGGINWQLASYSTVPNYRVRDICFADAKEGWIVGNLDTIYHSVDSGKTWTKERLYTGALKAIHFVDGDEGWIVGKSGTVLYMNRDNSSNVIYNPLVEQKISLKTIKGYPNPFSSGTSIKIELKETSEIELVIFNISGRKIKSFYKGVHQPGTFRNVWLGDDDKGNPVAKGVYYAVLKIKHGDKVAQRQVCLHKL